MQTSLQTALSVTIPFFYTKRSLLCLNNMKRNDMALVHTIKIVQRRGQKMRPSYWQCVDTNVLVQHY